MRLPSIVVVAVALGLSGCGAESYGVAANGFFQPQIGDAYIALSHESFLGTGDAAAVVIAPGIAVTNAHNANIVDSASVIGTAPGFDLLYFRTDKTAMMTTAQPRDGEAVIAYGQGIKGELRVSHGVIRKFWPAAFGYVSAAGPGFSGGPVVDAQSGALVGITYGYLDNADSQGRLMVAYDMAFVKSELNKLCADCRKSP